MKSENFQLKKIGFISKLNGYKGELVLASGDDDFLEEKFLFMKIDGIDIPFAVENIFEKGGNVIVKFEDVDNEEQAVMFMNQEVFMEQKRKKKSRGVESILDLVGFHLLDSASGDLGPIIRIDEFPHQQIAVCIVNGKEILIPLNDDFIDEIDDENKQIKVTLPDGLVDIYLQP